MAAPGRKKGPAPKPSRTRKPPAARPAASLSPRTAPPAPADGDDLPRNGLGLTGLVLGILAVVTSLTVVLGIILGVPAMIVGFLAVKRVRAGQATNFRSSVTAVLLGVVAVAVAIGLILYGRNLLNSPAGKRYTACIDAAGKDKAARAICEDTFDRER